MPSLIERLKLIALLSPAIFLANLWVLFVSDTPFIQTLGLLQILLTSIGVAIMASYFIVLAVFAFIQVAQEN